MRIQSIEIENITSLRGKHQIDLADSLQGEELFAITGPTGSGKSSLLSAISLALYGRTYKGSLSANDFVTTGEAFAMASLKFTLAGKNYQANWSIKTLKKNGDPIKAPKPSREMICEGVALENANASEILGLDFDQFCKTIILNQGQFAEFLHSSFKERKDIIEKLYRTGELSELGKLLKEKIKKEEHQLELSQAHYEKALPYTDEEIKLIKEELAVNQELLEMHLDLTKLFSPAFTDLNHLYQKLKEEKDYQNKVTESNISLEKLTNGWNETKKTQQNFKLAYEKLKARSEKESPLLREAIKYKTNLDNARRSASKTKLELDSNSKSLIEINSNLQNKKETRLETNQKLEKLLTSYSNKKLFNSKSMNEIYSFKEDLSKLKQYATEIEKNRTEYDLYQKEIDNLIKALKLKENHLKDQNKEGFDLSGDSTEIMARLRRNREANLELWNQLERYALELIKLFKNNENLLNSLKDRSDHFELKSTKLENLKLQIENEKLNHAINYCIEVANKDGECPICQNTDLPKELGHKETLKVSNEEFKSLDDEVAKLSFQKEADLTSIEKNKEEIKKIIDIVKKICTNLFPKINKEIKWQSYEEVDQGLKIFKELNQENLNSNLNQQEELGILLNLSKEINDLIKLIEEKKKSALELDMNLSKTNALVDLFLNNWKEILPKSKSPKEILGEFEKDLEIFNENIQVSQKLTSLNEIIESETKRSKQLEKKIELDSKSLEELEASIADLDEKLEVICGEKNPIELLEELEKQERITNQAFQKANDELLKAEKQKTNIEQSLRVYNEQIADLQNLQMSYIKKLKLIFKDLSGYAKDIPKSYPLYEICQDVFKSSSKWIELPEGGGNSDLLPIIESRLQSTWNDLNEKITDISLELKTSVQTNKSRIVEYNQKLEGRSELEQSLNKLKKSLQLKKRLAEVFGKDEFRSYALGLLEEELVLGANQELDELCDGRYQLKLLPGRGGQMEFFVSDAWRESILRKIDTLSGGETFLASLAMALALAELTRGQNEIDSFFIDEGFGHLDGDSIEEVLEVLMNIQNRGKQIGIISHVKALTDRIPVNLTLQKTSLGESTTEFVYN